MRRSRVVLLVIFTALLSSTAHGAEESELFVVKHLHLVDGDGVEIGEYLVAQQRDPTAEVGLLISPAGGRARLSNWLDTEAGVSIQRFEDGSSGWWAELRLDFGFRNMGEAEDFDSPTGWFQANYDRLQRLDAPATYMLATSDGPSARWLEPLGDREEAKAARVEALARLATGLAESPPPSSAIASLGLANRFVLGDDGHDSCGRLIEALTAALEVGTGASPSANVEVAIRAANPKHTVARSHLLDGLEPVGRSQKEEPQR